MNVQALSELLLQVFKNNQTIRKGESTTSHKMIFFQAGRLELHSINTFFTHTEPIWRHIPNKKDKI